MYVRGSLLTLGRKMKTNGSQWSAAHEGEVLHIMGIARFPNQFSTAGLERIAGSSPECMTFRLAFHRDKEPFCDADGIGPVHHYERHVSPKIRRIEVRTDDETIEIHIGNEK
jgi:hypothetical protein